MSSAIPTPPGLELPIRGKGTYVQWTDMSPSPLARTSLGVVRALTASASLSIAPWCSTPKLSDISKPQQIQTSPMPSVDIITSTTGELDFMRTRTCTGEDMCGDACASPLVRAVSAVASFGLMSWRISRITKRNTPLESCAEAREARSVSSNVSTRKQSSTVLPSVGSLSHSAGSCKPCAWFWKPKGCANGAECKHCHLCPQDELRRRKKAKVSQLKGEKSEDPQDDILEADPRSIVPERASTCTGSVCHMEQGTVDEDSVYISAPNNGHDSSNIVEFAADPQDDNLEADTRSIVPERARTYTGSVCHMEQGTVGEESVNISVPKNSDGSCKIVEFESTHASEGSRLHGSGECRPCSWFWKPKGCQFGAECLHCHLCPDGEQKRRKKDKIIALREAGVPKNKQVHGVSPNF